MSGEILILEIKGFPVGPLGFWTINKAFQQPPQVKVIRLKNESDVDNNF